MVDLDCLVGGGGGENRQAEMFVLRILRYSADGNVGQLQDESLSPGLSTF